MLAPRFVHLPTAIHGLGSLACFVMAVGSARSEAFLQGLAVSGGSALMVAYFGRGTSAFLAAIGLVLLTLAIASFKLLPWAWHLTLVVYGIGVLGSLWQVSQGIAEGWMAAVVNAAVVACALTPAVRRAYLRR